MALEVPPAMRLSRLLGRKPLPFLPSPLGLPLCRRLASSAGAEDPWTTLGVRPGASSEEIKKAYRKQGE